MLNNKKGWLSASNTHTGNVPPPSSSTNQWLLLWSTTKNEKPNSKTQYRTLNIIYSFFFGNLLSLYDQIDWCLMCVVNVFLCVLLMFKQAGHHHHHNHHHSFFFISKWIFFDDFLSASAAGIYGRYIIG